MAKRSKHAELRANLVLIGGRGSGKSSVSKRIAVTNRGFQFFSVDALIRYESGGLSVPQIVEQRGWSGFRDLEFDVITKLTRMDRGLVIDCGGGVVVDLDDQGEEIFSKRKVECLRRNGLVVYLRHPFEYLAERIQGDENRPSLSDDRSFSEIMERREPWYLQAAHHVVACDGKSKLEIVQEILEFFFDETGISAANARARPPKS